MARKPANKSKAKPKAKPAYKKKSAVSRSDYTSSVCSTFIDSEVDLATNGDQYGNGRLCVPVGAGGATTVAAGADYSIQATIALDNRNQLLQSNTHASYIKMFNEWNCDGIYLDLLFTPKLRETADQVFMLVESGNKEPITTETAMCSDASHKMFQLGNNTQKLTFSHKFNTTADRINKKSVPVGAPITQDLTYLKILCKGNNSSGAAINVDDLKIKMRAKLYNRYRDMKVLTAPLN